jgi:hypothetical protein
LKDTANALQRAQEALGYKSNGSAPATVNVTSNDRNRSPVATGQDVVVTAGEAKTITLSGSDPEGAKLSYVVDQPKVGTVSGAGPVVTYTTAQDASGRDSFTFKVNNGTKDSALATVRITIQNEFQQHTDNTREYLKQGRLGDAKSEIQKALELRPTNSTAKDLKVEVESRLNLRALDLRLINLMRQLKVKESGPQLLLKDGTASPLPDSPREMSVWDGLKKEANEVKSGYGKWADTERQKNLSKVFNAITGGRNR